MPELALSQLVRNGDIVVLRAKSMMPAECSNTQNRPQTVEISLTAEVCAHTKAVANIYNNYRAAEFSSRAVSSSRSAKMLTVLNVFDVITLDARGFPLPHPLPPPLQHYLSFDCSAPESASSSHLHQPHSFYAPSLSAYDWSFSLKVVHILMMNIASVRDVPQLVVVVDDHCLGQVSTIVLCRLPGIRHQM